MMSRRGRPLGPLPGHLHLCPQLRPLVAFLRPSHRNRRLFHRNLRHMFASLWICHGPCRHRHHHQSKRPREILMKRMTNMTHSSIRPPNRVSQWALRQLGRFLMITKTCTRLLLHDTPHLLMMGGLRLRHLLVMQRPLSYPPLPLLRLIEPHRPHHPESLPLLQLIERRQDNLRMYKEVREQPGDRPI